MARIVKGEERGRPGRWLVDWTDALGKRRITTCDTLEKAQHVKARAELERTMRRDCGLDPKLTLAQLVDIWKDLRFPLLRPQTAANYTFHLETHILKAFGSMRVTALSALVIERWAAQLKAQKYAESTICSMLSTLRNVLELGVRHGLLLKNPAKSIGRAMGLKPHDATQMKALNTGQLEKLLGAARAIDGDLYERLAFLADTALRVSEGFGARWEDVAFEAKQLSIERQASRYQGVSDLKTSSSKAVIDIPSSLVDLLRERRGRLRSEAFNKGQQLSPWIMCPEWGNAEPTRECVASSYYQLYRRMRSALRAAGLPQTYSPHSLRHTYVSRHLAEGVSPAYVQRQARHSSQATTVDLYGSWLKHRRPDEIDRLSASRKA